jgi:hypothetical protein
LKKIWKLLRQHVADDFSAKLYGSVAIFLAICVFFNYKVNFENGVIDKDVGKPVRILWYFLEMSFAYFGSTAIVFYCNKTLHHFRSRRYWQITLVALFFLALNLGFPYTRQIVEALNDQHYSLFRWTYGVVDNLINFLIQAFPLFVFAWWFEKRRENFGVHGRDIDLKPYWQILMIVLPLVLIASFESSFRNYYPVYKRYEVTEVNNPTGIPTWLFALGFEAAYGMDFFNVEFLFRGVLVIGVSQLIGKDAILPMVSAYCFLHFGKPLGECVSSIFGGYILGVVAFYTRNIWGGVMVHVGLAWMMEIAAFFQRALG